MSQLLLQLDQIAFPTDAADHFAAANLRALFHSKIARSQATGKDGVRIGPFSERIIEESEIIERKALNQSYNYTNFKERLLLRGSNREPRQISIPTVRDRLTLRALCNVLHATEPASTGSSPHAVVDAVVQAIREVQDGYSFVRIDVQNFFPSIVHKKLDQALNRTSLETFAKSLCAKAVRTPTGSGDAANARGVPQGLSISGALASIYMRRFDERMAGRFPYFYRYVDDILCLCPTTDAEATLRSISRSLNANGLKAHKLGVSGKTEIFPIDEGVDFLGYRLSREQVSIRKSSYDRMFRNVLKVITDYRYRQDPERTLFRLNLKISGCKVDNKRRGWMMFFARTEDKSQLAYLDRFVRDQLLRVGFPVELRNRVKTFIKSYHQIRYNLQDSLYIPNFDQFDQAQKIEVITSLTNFEEAEVLTWDILKIEQEFSKLISREIHDLEEDVGSPS